MVTLRTAARGDDPAQGVGPAHHGRRAGRSSASTACSRRRDVRGPHAGDDRAARLQRAHRRAAQDASRTTTSSTSRSACKGLSRFRANVLPAARRGRHGDPPDSRSRSCRSRQLGLPHVGRETSPNRPKGLVLVTGPDRAAASRRRWPRMLDRINAERRLPHRDDRGPDRVHAPSQEVHRSTSARSAPTPSRFATALKYVLRQDPGRDPDR